MKVDRKIFIVKFLEFSARLMVTCMTTGKLLANLQHGWWSCIKPCMVNMQSRGYCSPWVNVFFDFIYQEFARWFVAVVQWDYVCKPRGKCVLFGFFCCCERVIVKWYWKWRCLAWRLSSEILILFHNKPQPLTHPRWFSISIGMSFIENFSKKRFSLNHVCFISLFCVLFIFPSLPSLSSWLFVLVSFYLSFPFSLAF